MKKIVAIGLFAIIAIAVVVVLSLSNTDASNDVVVESNETIRGLRCEDMTLVHPVMEGNTSSSYENVISAIFNDDKLYSVSYRYEGIYGSDGLAKNAEAAAAAQYNIILANEYGKKIGVFSHNFTVDQAKLILIITANVDDASSETAPYFLLDSNVAFPKSFDEMKLAYEGRGMTCAEFD